MSELIKWGFVLSMGLTWVAIGVGVVMLIIPGKPRVPKTAAVEEKRAA